MGVLSTPCRCAKLLMISFAQVFEVFSGCNDKGHFVLRKHQIMKETMKPNVQTYNLVT